MRDYKEIIDQNLDSAEAVLKSFTKNSIGLISDYDKGTAKYKAAKSSFNYWWEELRKYNKQFLKTHKRTGFENVNGKRIAIYQPK